MRKLIWVLSVFCLLTGCGREAANTEPVPVPSVTEERAVLPGDYDFDHDGKADTVEVVTVLNGEGRPVWYELQINDCWVQEAMEAHPGWISIFAVEIDGADWLLRYNPSMGQGAAAYAYEVFSLDPAGEEQVLQKGGVEFDISFGAPHHSGFDPEAIAVFLHEVHGMLKESRILLSTQNGDVVTDVDGADFWYDDFTEGMLRESDDWEQTLREYQASRSNP